MSRIYFHSQHGDAEISGRERASAGWLAKEMLAIALELNDSYVDDKRQHPLTPFLPDYLRDMFGGRQYDAVRVYISVGDKPMMLPSGLTTDPFTLSLNTAWVMGSDPVRLMARLHGQCEIHCYVEGPNRDWLAGIIEQGLKIGVMRQDEHWDKVINLLRSRNDCPVVTSYSVCDQFPSRHVTNWKPTRTYEDGTPDYDEWYDLTSAEQWRLALAALREGSAGNGLEMKPDNWADFHFGHGETGYDVMKLVKQPAPTDR